MYNKLQSLKQIGVILFWLVTSRVSGRGHRIGAVFLCVCVCQHSLTAEPFDL